MDGTTCHRLPPGTYHVGLYIYMRRACFEKAFRSSCRRLFGALAVARQTVRLHAFIVATQPCGQDRNGALHLHKNDAGVQSPDACLHSVMPSLHALFLSVVLVQLLYLMKN